LAWEERPPVSALFLRRLRHRPRVALKENCRGLVVGILRHEVATKGFGEQSALELRQQRQDPSMLGRDLVERGERLDATDNLVLLEAPGARLCRARAHTLRDARHEEE
jgi:hypothetical protein